MNYVSIISLICTEFFLYFNILRPPHKVAITIKIGLVYNKI